MIFYWLFSLKFIVMTQCNDFIFSQMTANPFENKEQALKFIVSAIRRCAGDNFEDFEERMNGFSSRLKIYIGNQFNNLVDTLFDDDIKIFDGSFPSHNICRKLQNLQPSRIIYSVTDSNVYIMLCLFVYVYDSSKV